MASSYLSAPTPREARRRTASFALAVVAHALLIWLLLHLSPSLLPTSDKQPTLSTFDVASEPGSKPKAAPHEKTLAKAHSAAAKAKAAPQAERQATDRPPTPTPPNLSLFGHNALFAGGDVSKLASHADEGQVADSGASAGKGSGAVYGPGQGPGGSKLYNAEWYRRPSHAEIAGYMPPGGVAPGAWAEVACRTIPGNQVENCRSLGESPVGSGLARGLRLAAWQFRVLPPRIDGRPMIGAWVRIHLDFTEKADKAGDEADK